MIPGSGAASTLMDCHVQSGYACLNRRNYVIESRRDDSKNDCSKRMTRRLKILRRLVIPGKKTYLDIHYNVCRNQCKLCGKQNMKSYYPVIHRLRLLLLWSYS